MRWIRQLRRELGSLLELFLLPGLAVFLPWPLAYRVLRRIARHPALYAAEWRPALAQARTYLPIDDPQDWAWRYRTCRLVDHADYWLSRTRGAGWLARHCDRRGDWPSLSSPAVGVFFHWCNGLWAVRALRHSGPRSSVLAGHFSPRSMGGSLLAYLYGRLRLHELARASGAPLIYAPGTVRRALVTLDEGCWVIGTPDVPPSETRLAREVRLFGRPGQFAEGLLLIARKAQLPVVMFTMALDFASGRRELRVSGPFDAADPELLQRLVDYWSDLLQEKSWGFTLWPMMPAFVAPPPVTPQAG
jgi:phosphatidylinositol dimannoside acyltransferase